MIIVADIEILLATYYPAKGFFRRLLQSLNQQTFPNILLSVIDDSGNDDVYTEIAAALEAEITNFPFRVSKNEKNIGSNKTFERLTQEAQCEYIAYCDHDDIWEDCKLQKLVEELESSRAALCYSDLSVIDKNGTFIAQSFTKVNKRVRHLEGKALFPVLLRRNSVTGCTILMHTAIAKKALPFNTKYFVHDHWLALVASTYGQIAYIHEPLVQYRLHADNQIGKKTLAGIDDKHAYPTQKLQAELSKYEYLLSSGLFGASETEAIRQAYSWVKIRQAFFMKHTPGNTLGMLKILPKDPQLILFELFLSFAPTALGRKVIKRFQ